MRRKRPGALLFGDSIPIIVALDTLSIDKATGRIATGASMRTILQCRIGLVFARAAITLIGQPVLRATEFGLIPGRIITLDTILIVH